MARFFDIYDFVQTDLRGVETALIDHYTRQVCRDWLKATTEWRELISLPLKVGLVDYRFVPSSGSVSGVLDVGGVTDMDGNLVGRSCMPRYSEGAQFQGPRDAGPPDGWWQPFPGLIRFNRAPDALYTVPVTVYKQVTLDPEDDLIPDDVFENHAESLSFGIKARLQAMPAKPWTDTTMATVNNTYYTRAKFATRAKMRAGGGDAIQRVRAPRFAG